MPAIPPVHRGTDLNQTSSNFNADMPTLDRFGLHDIVGKLVNAGLSITNILEEINTKYMPDGKTVSKTALYRYVAREFPNRDDNRRNDSQLNVYKEYLNQMDIVDKQLAMIQTCMESLDKQIKKDEDVLRVTKEINAFSSTLEKLLARKSQLVNSISVIQEKVFDFTRVYDIVKVIMNDVMESDKTLYADIMNKLKDDDYFREFIKGIRK